MTVTGSAKHYLNKEMLTFTLVQLLKVKRQFLPTRGHRRPEGHGPAWLDSQRQLLESQGPPSSRASSCFPRAGHQAPGRERPPSLGLREDSWHPGGCSWPQLPEADVRGRGQACPSGGWVSVDFLPQHSGSSLPTQWRESSGTSFPPSCPTAWPWGGSFAFLDLGFLP